MTDCKGAFGFGYEIDIGGAQAAFAQYAGGKVKNPKKPSAGMTGIKVGGKYVQIVGYGCGDDTVPTAVKETRRLMEQLQADVMIGPLSGDEAVYVANYAKSHPTKTFIIGTAGSQDPTLQIAPKNMFRYHGDGAQWNAGIGEIAYKRLEAGATPRSSWTTTASAGRPRQASSPTSARSAARSRSGCSRRSTRPTTRRTSSSCRRPTRSTGTSGSSAGRARAASAQGVRAGLRGAQAEPAHREPVLRVPRRRQGRGPEGRRLVRRRLRHRPGAQDASRRRRTRPSWRSTTRG